MGILDAFCRFCTRKLDCSQRRNIFTAENRNLLETALKCMPLPMSEDDCYPSYTCYPCADKLNVIAEFQTNGLSAVNAFDAFLSQNEEISVQNWLMGVKLEVPLTNELLEGTECDAVEEISLKQEPRSYYGDEEEVACFDDKEQSYLTQGESYDLKDCTVKLTRFDDTSSEENAATLAESPSEIQCTAKTNNLPVTSPSQLHTEEKPYKCDECGRSFKQKTNYVSHTQLHSAEKPYKCKFCDVSFKLKRYLARHEVVHTGQRSNVCEHCNKTFSDKWTLVRHRKIHSGEKPARCEDCGKGFTRKSDLDKHKKIHAREKPYTCEDCGRGFNKKSTLDSHKRLHVEGKVCKCEHCGRSFDKKSALEIHNRIHTGEKPFVCQDCGKSFRQMSNFTRHKKLHVEEQTIKIHVLNRQKLQ